MGPRQEEHSHRQNGKKDEKQGHQNLIRPLNLIHRSGDQDDHGNGNDKNMPGQVFHIGCYLSEKFCGILCEHCICHRACQEAEHPADDDGIADGDPQRT